MSKRFPASLDVRVAVIEREMDLPVAKKGEQTRLYSASDGPPRERIVIRTRIRFYPNMHIVIRLEWQGSACDGTRNGSGGE